MPKKPTTYKAGQDHIGFTHSDGGVTVLRTNVPADKQKEQLSRVRQESQGDRERREMEEARKRVQAAEKARK